MSLEPLSSSMYMYVTQNALIVPCFVYRQIHIESSFVRSPRLYAFGPSELLGTSSVYSSFMIRRIETRCCG